MQRVTTPTAVQEKPAYGATGTPGFFRSGDPVQAIPATVPGADWFNRVQEEIINVLRAAGIEPSALDDAQLLQAIKTLGPDRFKGFNTSGDHIVYDADLDDIAHNSLYAVQQGTALHTPGDLPADGWGFCHTMVLPGDGGRTQVVWSCEDTASGWARRREAGVWSDWKPLGSGGGLAVGTVVWVPGKTPPPGMLAINTGALLPRAAYPDLWAYAQSSGLLITDAEWQAQAAAQTSVGAFSDGDGATTFRLPRLVDFISASDPGAGRAPGTFRADDLKSHTHSVRVPAASGSAAGGNVSGSYGIFVDSSATGGSETRPKSISWLPCIQAFSAITNSGTLDMAALAASVANKVDRSDWVELVPGRAWRRPDGIIEQIGETGVVAGGAQITFPVQFPAELLGVGLTPCAGQTSGVTTQSYTPYGKVGFQYYSINSAGSAYPLNCKYRAIGR